MRWYWIDRFLEFNSGRSCQSVKNVSLAEEHLHDHFPGYPVMPASLIIEGLAQTGGILVGEATRNIVRDVVFREVDRVKVKGKDEAVTIYEPLGLEGRSIKRSWTR